MEKRNELYVHVVDRARHLIDEWLAVHAPSRNSPTQQGLKQMCANSQ